VAEYYISFQALVKKNLVFFIALFLAVITCFIVPPSSAYLTYFDFRTLTCLFCILAVICAFNNIFFFHIVSRSLVSLVRNTRSSVLVMVYITLVGSMFITNDMALIIFLPLSYLVLESTGQTRLLTFTFIMQNFAANLGGMLTPFGNPQNLYLYSFYHIGNTEFIKIMFIPFVISTILITLCCLFIKKEPLLLVDDYQQPLQAHRVTAYTLLFIFTVLIVFRVIPYIYGWLVIPLALWFLDRKALKDLDYFLLLTFCCFFIFSGNVSRIPLAQEFFLYITDLSILLSGVITSQLISNVPSAILLSHFTSNYADLLVAVNIGGVGTLVASLASLITLREYTKRNPHQQLFFIKQFSVYNFAFLVVLTSACLLIG